MADPGIGTRGESIDLLTALDLLGKAEERVAELEAALESILVAEDWPTCPDCAFDSGPYLLPCAVHSVKNIASGALAAVRQEKP